LSGSPSKSRLTCEHLQTPSEIFSGLDWQKQFDGALARTGVGLDTNSDREAYTALGPICVSAGFWEGPGKTRIYFIAINLQRVVRAGTTGNFGK
jgi:hypothetical protein